MNLINYNPRFSENRFGNVLDDFFNKSISEVIGSDFTMNLPALNVVENENQFVLELGSPGLKKSDFNIEIEEDRLIIAVEVTRNEEEGKIRRREFNYQSFRRSLYLPETIDQEKIEASYENGVLIIKLPKLSKEAPSEQFRRIDIS